MAIAKEQQSLPKEIDRDLAAARLSLENISKNAINKQMQKLKIRILSLINIKLGLLIITYLLYNYEDMTRANENVTVERRNIL